MKNKTLFLNPLILLFFTFIFIVLSVLFCLKIFGIESEEVSSKPVEIIVKKNQNPINLNEVLQKNISEDIVQEMISEELDLEYITEYRNNDKLPKGTIQVVQEGRLGLQQAVIIRKYKNETLISEDVVSENLIKSPVNKIVEIGVGLGTNNYKPVVGDHVFVTSNLLVVRAEPNNDSEKVCTLKKDDEIKISKINGDYLYIISKERNGYIPKDCITNINPNNKNIFTDDSKSTDKSVLISKLNIGMDVGKPSGLSLNQFKKALENQTMDKNNVFKENAEYFYYAEKQYGINGIFLAAVGIHESAFGTSKISLDKKNLFGYGAVDSNPYSGAYSFNTYSEGIDLLARVFIKYYLNSKGTLIYDGNVADGRFYSGNTILDVNKKYASDSNWGNSVFNWMKVLYNNI